MVVYIWAAMFYIVVFIGFLSIIGMFISRSTEGTNRKIDELQNQIKKLEDEIKKKN